MERLGESVEFGMLLLGLLGTAGWSVVVTRGFAGGVLVVCRWRDLEVRRQGDTVADIAHDVFTECMSRRHPGRLAA